MEEQKKEKAVENIMGTRPIPELVLKFAVPAVISMLVNSIYNLVDQIFIGHGVGYLGNAATNVVFPFVTLGLAVSLMVSVGTAANVGLDLGKGDQKQANRILGNGISLALIMGTLILVFGQLFLVPLLKLFGATETVLPYAVEYGRIYLMGILFTTVGIITSDLIRADGDPGYAMLMMLAGAVVNIIFDPLFIFVMKWGVAGAAIATIMGQFVTMVLGLLRIRKLRTLQFEKANMKPDLKLCTGIMTLGLSSFLTQMAAMVQQIVMNQQTIRYGALSKYGADIPLTVFGIVGKINGLMFAFILGIAVGTQPLFSFNYGAAKYDRVKQLVRTTLIACVSIGFVCMLGLQIFPSQIISVFGQESELYNEFAVMCLKNMTILIFVMGVQIVAGSYYQAVGKPMGATILSLSRQIIFLIPLLMIMPVFFGLKGVMWSFPVSDFASVVLGAIMLSKEMKVLNKLMKN